MAADERPHAILLAHRLIEFVESIAELTPLQREATLSSLESGSLIRDVESALVAARQREREQHEHPTPLVPEPFRPTLPTVPPCVDQGEVPTKRVRSVTVRGFPRAE